MTADERRAAAEGFFLDGYNCAQAVVLAFAEDMGVQGNELERISSIAESFGGGFGRLREICGAVSGTGIVIGAVRKGQDRATRYKEVQEIAGEFSKKNGSIVCRELLGAKLAAINPTPDARTPEYYKTRPCAKLVGDAAEILHIHLAGEPSSYKTT